MNQTFLSVGLFVLLFAAVPFGVRWVKRRATSGSSMPAGTLTLVSAVAVGPHQRVVTVEAGPEEARVWLTLGVTAQDISILHSASVASPQEKKDLTFENLGPDR